MNGFETELGVMSEIAEAVNNMGWLLPTDIQAEAIPLILGGGDVLMAAETGSGKTGAFCLPVIQIVYETLKEIQENKNVPKSQSTKSISNHVKMSAYDRTPALAICPEGLLCQSRDENQWHGCRANKGVINSGKYYYEATVTDEGLCRVGWSVADAVLDLGVDRLGFGYGGTGKKSNNKQFDNYGESYGINDTIGCWIDLDNMRIKWSKNGIDLGNAFNLSSNLKNYAFYPAVCMKNAEIKFNFGETSFKYPPTSDYAAIAHAPKDNLVDSLRSSGITRGSIKKENNAPLALIIEPSKELAEQTLQQIETFKKKLTSPAIREVLIVGGIPIKEQMAALQNGVDIVVATPGRLADLISSNVVSLDQVRFFVLDEVDGLLSQGHREFITNIYRKIPPFSQDGRRLQMIVCSATLHNFEVKKLADQLMHFPTWIDLKGQDTVPETIHHCVCLIDPREDGEWRTMKRRIRADGVHDTDILNFQSDSKEMLSQAVKLLKAEYCIRAIEKYKMDKALIFCRTKLDCDNLETYLNRIGKDSNRLSEFSCVCLHSDRNAKERTENLEKFKENKVRFLICTDVAARGLDISGLPFVINMTLPDEKQNYIHRIGRVGRADRMGLAISFVSKVQEKVWYHTCSSRGKHCENRSLKDDGGCCIWYNEMYYLDEIEEHLGCTIDQIPKTLEVPVNEFDGKVVYGEKRKTKANLFKGHVQILEPSVNELLYLEKKTQATYLYMKYNKNFIASLR